MLTIRKNEATIKAGQARAISKYYMDDGALDGLTIEINGLAPVKGYKINRISNTARRAIKGRGEANINPAREKPIIPYHERRKTFPRWQLRNILPAGIAGFAARRGLKSVKNERNNRVFMSRIKEL